MEGVETEEEFRHSKKQLDFFLKHHGKSSNKYVKHNAKVLYDFLEQRVMIHKHRWFFPARQRLTLNQRTTSPCEVQNQIMKWGASKVVKPNMSLLESLITQEGQVDARMDELRLVVQKEVNSRPLWSCTKTARAVTTVCESQLQLQRQLSTCYGCRRQTPLAIQVKHRAHHDFFFCQSCDFPRGQYCDLHCPSSPVSRFKRTRTLSFVPIPGAQARSSF